MDDPDHRNPITSVDEVQGGSDDAVGVDAVVVIDVLKISGLSKPGHAEVVAGHLIDVG